MKLGSIKEIFTEANQEEINVMFTMYSSILSLISCISQLCKDSHHISPICPPIQTHRPLNVLCPHCKEPKDINCSINSVKI